MIEKIMAKKMSMQLLDKIDRSTDKGEIDRIREVSIAIAEYAELKSMNTATYKEKLGHDGYQKYLGDLREARQKAENAVNRL